MKHNVEMMMPDCYTEMDSGEVMLLGGSGDDYAKYKDDSAQAGVTTLGIGAGFVAAGIGMGVGAHALQRSQSEELSMGLGIGCGFAIFIGAVTMIAGACFLTGGND